jgi:hypothetical protein
MGAVRVGCAIAVVLVLPAVGEAASPPPDRLPPTRPTVDGSRETPDLRPVFHFGARDNRTPPSQIRFRCGIDTPFLHPCARIYQPFSALAFGPHLLHVRATDRAGNTSRLTTTAFAVVGTWDAAVDFARAPRPENPGHDRYGNTTWFYLYSASKVHDPTLYLPLPEFHAFDSNNQAWNRGLTPDGFNVLPLVGVASAEMVFHPDRDSFAVLGWRSPYTGTVSLDMQLRFPDPVTQAPSNGVIWSIDRDGSTLQSQLLTPANQAHIAITLDVNTGDTLYLVIDNNEDSNYDTTIGEFRVKTIPG